jgi:hypothetical protein
MRVVFAAVVILAILAPPASAERNPYTAREVCGSSYHAIDHEVLVDAGKRLARVVLMYSPSTGNNCTVTLKRGMVGRRSFTAAGLGPINQPFHVDQGLFRYYAGPVYAHAPHTCVKWSGVARPGRLSDDYVSPYEHCE